MKRIQLFNSSTITGMSLQNLIFLQITRFLNRHVLLFTKAFPMIPLPLLTPDSLSLTSQPFHPEWKHSLQVLTSFEVSTSVKIEFVVFCVVAPYSGMVGYQYFGPLKQWYPTITNTWCNNPENYEFEVLINSLWYRQYLSCKSLPS